MKTTLLCAITLDGFLNHESEARVDFSSQEDRTWFKQKAHKVGVMIMGATTYEHNFSKPMPGILHIVMTRTPEKFESSNDVIVTDATPAGILAMLEARGIKETLVIGGGQINSLFLHANLLDEALITLTPHYFGSGVPLFAGGASANFKLLDSKPMGPGELLLHYSVKK